jgi:hypothetical protein
MLEKLSELCAGPEAPPPYRASISRWGITGMCRSGMPENAMPSTGTIRSQLLTGLGGRAAFLGASLTATSVHYGLGHHPRHAAAPVMGDVFGRREGPIWLAREA